MVLCDNLSCKYEWFQFSCVKLKTPPVELKLGSAQIVKCPFHLLNIVIITVIKLLDDCTIISCCATNVKNVQCAWLIVHELLTQIGL